MFDEIPCMGSGRGVHPAVGRAQVGSPDLELPTGNPAKLEPRATASGLRLALEDSNPTINK